MADKENEKSLFRKEALETVANPEQLDQHVRITRPSVWVIMFAIIALVVGAAIWSFTFNMTQGVNLSGILFPSDGAVISYAKTAGMVRDTLYTENEAVQKGDFIAVIPDVKLLEQIQTARAQNASAVTIDALVYQYVSNSFITADRAGTITSIATDGSTVALGDQIAVNISESTESRTKEVISYIPYTASIGLKAGSIAEISPAQYQRAEYGYMKGVVTRVGTNPVTAESITRSLGSTKYVESLGITGNDFVEIRIRLNSDTQTNSGFEWSNAKGRQLDVETGNLCNVRIITGSQHPINMLFK